MNDGDGSRDHIAQLERARLEGWPPRERAMSEAAARFRQGVIDGDAEAMLGALAPNAFLRSPVAGGLRFQGREQLAELFAATTDAYDDVELTHDFGAEGQWVLGFRARIDGQAFQETLLIGLADDGRIAELTASIRPLPGAAEVAAAVGSRIARRQGRARGFALALLTAPLLRMARSGETIGPRLLGTGTHDHEGR